MMRKKEQQNERTLISIKIGASDITLAPTLEVPPRFELGVELLQSSALPLGYVAVWITGAKFAPVIFCMEQVTRLELATSTLARWRSTR